MHMLTLLKALLEDYLVTKLEIHRNRRLNALRSRGIYSTKP